MTPRRGPANGSAVVVFPGGAYAHLAGDLEGRRGGRLVHSARICRLCRELPALARTDTSCRFRCSMRRRAIQTVRARAADYHIEPNRIVVIGFSAGGHLAALAGTQFVPGNPDAEDPIDRVSSRPDYMVLGYPWIGAISTDTSHLSYCKLFNVMDQCDALRAKYYSHAVCHQGHAADLHLPHLHRPDGARAAEPGLLSRRW